MTIGPRFGGALDQAAETFQKAYDSDMSIDIEVRQRALGWRQYSHILTKMKMNLNG